MSLGALLFAPQQKVHPEAELQHDAAFLQRVWAKVLKRVLALNLKINCLYRDLVLPFRVLRDFVGTKIDRVRIDSKITFTEIKEFTQEFVPELENKVEYYEGDSPIFDLFDVENEVQRALERKVTILSQVGI